MLRALNFACQKISSYVFAIVFILFRSRQFSLLIFLSFLRRFNFFWLIFFLVFFFSHLGANFYCVPLYVRRQFILCFLLLVFSHASVPVRLCLLLFLYRARFVPQRKTCSGIIFRERDALYCIIKFHHDSLFVHISLLLLLFLPLTASTPLPFDVEVFSRVDTTKQLTRKNKRGVTR